jgi:hypothetical protein
LLKIQCNAHTVHKNHALINHILTGDLGVPETMQHVQGADKFDTLRGFAFWSVEHVDGGNVETIEVLTCGDLGEKILELGSDEEIEGLGYALVN